MLKVGVDALLALSVPQFHRLVVTARHQESSVRRKPATFEHTVVSSY